jgi:hypothetical protein
VSATVDRDQLAALRVLRYWFGVVEVVEVREGSGEGNPPRLTGDQLALSFEVPDGAPLPGCSRAEAAGRGRPAPPLTASPGHP